DRTRGLHAGHPLHRRLGAALDRWTNDGSLGGAGDGMSGVRMQTVARDEDGMRLDRWFATHFPQVTFGHLQKLLRSGQVRVDSGRVKSNHRLASGQVVRVPPIGEAPEKPEGQVDSDEARFLRDLILYEDDE